MKSVRTILFWVALLFFTGSSLQAQQSSVPSKGPDPGFAKRWRIGLNLGPDFYYGDLNSSKFWPERSIGFATGLFGEYQATNVFGFRLQLLGAWLNGTKTIEVNGAPVDESFTGIVLDGTFNAQLNFTNLFSPYRASRNFFVYGTLGIGYAGWYTKLVNKVYDANTLNTDNPVNNFNGAMVVPAGLGFTYRVGGRINVGLEWTFRTVFSDKVDQTVGGYKYDSYNYLAFGISINLGKGSSNKPEPRGYNIPVAAPAPTQPTPAPGPEPLQYTPPAQDVNYDYTVQIFAFERHRYSAQWIKKRYKIPVTVRVEKEGSLDRFLVGDFKTLQEAMRLRDQMIRLGIRDAFVVAYRNGVRSHAIPNAQ